ncbi:MAG: CpXC domain-containing protein [Planctomycetia bacterium]|nr:CpXC domain-containing protein [Planctomycetia bacterium]
MSIFEDVTLACPACQGEVPFSAAFSINADRRPDLREAILDESLQAENCPHCGKRFRLAPDINYIDIENGQWLAAHPIDQSGQWKRYESEDRAGFDKAYGNGASATAKSIGAGLVARITFGWPGLREKIVVRQKNLDDVTLELVKLAIIRNVDSPLDQDTELRLVDADDALLYFVWFRVPSEEFIEGMQVPRSLYDEITADVEGWGALRSQFDGALYVDMNRLLIETDAE